jgi:plastocyanin
MFRRSRLGVLCVVTCALGTVMALPAVAAAHTKVVFAGGPAGFANQIQHRYGAGVNNFLNNRVTIHAGDSVQWDGKSLQGGFHTVDIPALGESDQPLIVPTGTNVSGVNDAAGSPFWFNGQPNLTFNPALFRSQGGHRYNGSTRIDSGLPLGPPQSFKVQFTKPGVYHYFCDVHYGMRGTVVVLAKAKRIPSTKQDAKTLKKAEAAYVATAKKVDKTTEPANTVGLGASGPGGLEVFAMFPSTLSVASGSTVTFAMSKDTRETHTATFGDLANGGYVSNLAQTAFNSPTGLIDPRGAYPSSVPMPVSLSQTSHGNGFGNTGALDQDAATPLPPAAQVKFTQPGTYHYVCLIHPFMQGTIVVH